MFVEPLGGRRYVDLTPSGRYKDKREIQQKRRNRWEGKTKNGGLYTREFKAEAVALAEKHEKPVRQGTADLGINENMPRRWMRRAREAGGSSLPPFPGHGRPRDEELTRMGKEVKAPREAV